MKSQVAGIKPGTEVACRSAVLFDMAETRLKALNTLPTDINPCCCSPSAVTQSSFAYVDGYRHRENFETIRTSAHSSAPCLKSPLIHLNPV